MGRKILWILLGFLGPQEALTSHSLIFQATAKNPPGPVVFITRTGKRYHRPACRYLFSKIETTVKKAQAAGFMPCGSCKPQRTASAQAGDTPIKTASDRCYGKTQMGQRWKRIVKVKKYCWQHA